MHPRSCSTIRCSMVNQEYALSPDGSLLHTQSIHVLRQKSRACSVLSGNHYTAQCSAQKAATMSAGSRRISNGHSVSAGAAGKVTAASTVGARKSLLREVVCSNCLTSRPPRLRTGAEVGACRTDVLADKGCSGVGGSNCASKTASSSGNSPE